MDCYKQITFGQCVAVEQSLEVGAKSPNKSCYPVLFSWNEKLLWNKEAFLDQWAGCLRKKYGNYLVE